MRLRRWWTTTAAVLAMGGLPMAAGACAVCFGQTDSPLGKGLHWGVFALLMCIMATLVAFGTFAVYLVRRASAVEAEMALEGGTSPEVPRRWRTDTGTDAGTDAGADAGAKTGDLS